MLINSNSFTCETVGSAKNNCYSNSQSKLEKNFKIHQNDHKNSGRPSDNTPGLEERLSGNASQTQNRR